MNPYLPPDRRTVTFNSESQWTYQERVTTMGFVRIFIWLLGVASLIVSIISATMSALFAYSLAVTPTQKMFFAVAAICFASCKLGIPLARPYFQARRKEEFEWPFWLWIVLLVFSAIGAAIFQVHELSAPEPEPVAITAAPRLASKAPETPRSKDEQELARLTEKLDALGPVGPIVNLRSKLEDALFYCNDGEREACKEARELRQRIKATEEAIKIDGQILALERKIKAAAAAPSPPAVSVDVAPSIPAAQPPAPQVQGFGGLLASYVGAIVVALMIEAVSALGFWIAAESAFAIVREKPDAPIAAPSAPAAPAIPIRPQDEKTVSRENGFLSWARRNVSKKAGGKMESGKAFASYVNWASANGVVDVFSNNTFGRRLTDYVTGIGGTWAHSGGSIYRDVVLIDDQGEELLPAEGLSNA
jgi:hypothetical protein